MGQSDEVRVALIVFAIAVDLAFVAVHRPVGRLLFRIYRSLGVARDQALFMMLFSAVVLGAGTLVLGVLVLALV
jgi:hypothetical protein